MQAVVDVSERMPDAVSRRSAGCVLAASTLIFAGLVPFAKVGVGPAAWFIPLAQSVLILNDLFTAALLIGQLRLTGRPELAILVGGYLYTAAMASIHMLTFPGVFAPAGLLGGGAQTTAYLHVFWHIGLPCAAMAFVVVQQRRPPPMARIGRAVLLTVAAVAAAVLAFALLTTRGNDLLPPLLAGNRYSSAFNIGRYGQWAVTACAVVVLWRKRPRSVLDLWLLVMLCNSFFEIALVSIVNAGRYDVGFYAGRVFAVFSSSIVLVMLLAEHGRLHRELAEAHVTARSEAELRESREAMRLAMESGRMASWTRDLPSARTWWSPEVEQLTGWSGAALNAHDDFFLQHVHPDDREAARRAIAPGEQDAAAQQDFAVEFRVRDAEGGWRWLDCRGHIQVDEQSGRAERLFGILIDITERKDSAQAVARILESITDGFFAVDAEWRFTYVNREAERLLQRSRSELLGRTLWEAFPGAAGSSFQRRYERARAQNETVSFEEYYPPLGIWVEVRAFPSGGGLSVYFHDVSARHQAQEELRQSEESYRLLADMIPQHIWVTEPNGYHNYFSRSWYEFTGTEPGKSDGEGWAAMLHPDDREATMRTWEHSLRTGEPYSVEYRFRGADGQYRWFIGQAAPLKDSTGRILRWFGTLTDISERKQHEAERERLLASERRAREEAERRRRELERVTESRARLMRGFSHDLRSPLGAADMSALLLEDGRAFGPLGEKQRESVRRIRRGIRSSLRLIDDLLELARAEAGQIDMDLRVFDVAEIAREIVEEFQAQATTVGLELEARVPPGLQVQADAMRVRQILANLVSNAIKYAPRGRATIHAASPRPGSERPDRVAVCVIDTGPGIPGDKRELVFEEYTRLDPGAQQGSGIGLAISRRVARLMGGDITLESEPGRGSAFTLWLPVASATQVEQTESAANAVK